MARQSEKEARPRQAALCPKHFCFVDPLLFKKKKKLKIVFYGCVSIYMSIIQGGLYLFLFTDFRRN